MRSKSCVTSRAPKNIRIGASHIKLTMITDFLNSDGS